MSAQLASPAASRRRHIHHSHSRHRTSASQAQSRLPCANDSVEAHKEVSAISSPTSPPGALTWSSSSPGPERMHAGRCPCPNPCG